MEEIVVAGRTALGKFFRRVADRLAPEAEEAYPPFVMRTIAEAQPYSMTSSARLASLIDAVDYVERRGIAGAIVECGVWRGGSAIAALRTLRNLSSDNRDVYLYDTYDGMSEPTEHDRETTTGNTAASLLSHADKSEPVWARAGLADVQRNVSAVGYPSSRIHYVVGKVEDTIPATLPSAIALLRLDTDWYESTKHELNHLYPLLAPGGVLIIDDYGHWAGARKAVDEYFATRERAILLHRIDYTGRIAIKPGTV